MNDNDDRYATATLTPKLPRSPSGPALSQRAWRSLSFVHSPATLPNRLDTRHRRPPSAERPASSVDFRAGR